MQCVVKEMKEETMRSLKALLCCLGMVLSALADDVHVKSGDFDEPGGWKIEGDVIVAAGMEEAEATVRTPGAGSVYCWAKILSGSDFVIDIGGTRFAAKTKSDLKSGTYSWIKLGQVMLVAGYTSVSLICGDQTARSSLSEIVLTMEPDWRPPEDELATQPMKEVIVRPGANLAKVRDEIRIRRSPDKSQVSVIFEDGVYEMRETLILDERDDNVMWTARHPHKVTIVGGSAFCGRDARKIDQTSAFAKRLNPDAVGKVYQLSVPDEIRPLFSTNKVYREASNSLYSSTPDEFRRDDEEWCIKGGNAPRHPSFSVDSRFMWPARWPNGGVYYVVPGKDIHEGEGDSQSLCIPDARVRSWKLDGRPAFVYGFVANGCAYRREARDILGFDMSGNICVEKKGIVPRSRMWFLNIVEELDAPGEWVYDYASGTILFIPPAGFGQDSLLAIGTHTDNLFHIVGSGIEIRGIDFTGKVGLPAICIEKGRNNCIRGCRFRGLACSAAMWVAGRNSLVKDCDFIETSDMGLALRGGSAKTCDWGRNVAENCLFDRCSLIHGSWARGGIQVAGAGNRVAHCEVKNIVENGLNFSGFNNTIEYNRVYNISSDWGDAGAVCTGGQASYGHIIRYNDIQSAPGFVNGIYIDDMSSGNVIYGNIVRNFGFFGIFLSGGRDNVVSNNIMTSGWGGIRLDNRGLTWPAWKDVPAVVANLNQLYDFKDGPLGRLFPQLAAWDASDKYCLGYVNCRFENNLFLDLKGYSSVVQISRPKTKTVPRDRYMASGNVVIRTKGVIGRFDMEHPELMPTNQYSGCGLSFRPFCEPKVIDGTPDNPLDLGFKNVPAPAFDPEQYMIIQQGWIDEPKLEEMRMSGKLDGVKYPIGDYTLKEDARLRTIMPDFQPIPWDKIGLYKDEWRIELPDMK